MKEECVRGEGFPTTKGHLRVNIKRNGRWTTTLAHRLAWTQAYGTPPDGAVVHHKCFTPWCVNLDHLEIQVTGDHNAIHKTWVVCPRCGSADKAPNGQCRRCKAAYMHEYKRRK